MYMYMSVLLAIQCAVCQTEHQYEFTGHNEALLMGYIHIEGEGDGLCSAFTTCRVPTNTVENCILHVSHSMQRPLVN